MSKRIYVPQVKLPGQNQLMDRAMHGVLNSVALHRQFTPKKKKGGETNSVEQACNRLFHGGILRLKQIKDLLNSTINDLEQGDL